MAPVPVETKAHVLILSLFIVLISTATSEEERSRRANNPACNPCTCTATENRPVARCRDIVWHRIPWTNIAANNPMTLNLEGAGLEQTLGREGRFFADRYLTDITKLVLDRNEIKRLGGRTFSRMGRLDELSLASNSLQSLEDNCFSELHALRRLSLRRNLLTAVTSGMLKGCVSLVHLDLSHNRIGRLEPAAFAQLHELRTVTLSNNDLTVVAAGGGPAPFAALGQLQSLDVTANPWDCSCRLRTFALWYRRHKFGLGKSPRCRSQGRYFNKTWDQLLAAEFACSPDFSAEHRSSVERNDSVIFTCAVTGDPRPSVHWEYKHNNSDSGLLLLQSSRVSELFDVAEKRTVWKHTLNFNLTAINSSHVGIYLCVAENQADKKTDIFTLSRDRGGRSGDSGKHFGRDGAVTEGAVTLADLSLELLLILTVAIALLLVICVVLVVTCRYRANGAADKNMPNGYQQMATKSSAEQQPYVDECDWYEADGQRRRPIAASLVLLEEAEEEEGTGLCGRRRPKNPDDSGYVDYSGRSSSSQQRATPSPRAPAPLALPDHGTEEQLKETAL